MGKLLPLTWLKSQKKVNMPITFSSNVLSSSELIKKEVISVPFLVHPVPDAQMSLAVDASRSTVGAVLQHSDNNSTQTLAHFSCQLKPMERRYSTFDCELLMVYLTVQYFQYQLKCCDIVILTDHKPLTFASLSKSEKLSLRAFHHRLHFTVYK